MLKNILYIEIILNVSSKLQINQKTYNNQRKTKILIFFKNILIFRSVSIRFSTGPKYSYTLILPYPVLQN